MLGLRICIIFMRIRFSSFTSMRIRFSTFTSMRIRISRSDFSSCCGSGSGCCSSSQSNANLRPMGYGTKYVRYSPRLYLESPRPSMLHYDFLKLLNFDLNADPDPAFHFNADRNQLRKIMRIHADPHPQPWFGLCI